MSHDGGVEQYVEWTGDTKSYVHFMLDSKGETL